MIRLGITIGDPAGIGPELILKLAAADVLGDATLVVFGARSVLERTAREIPALQPFRGDLIETLDESPDYQQGKPSAYGARLQYASLVAAIEAAKARNVDAIVTTPWTKHILALAGLPATGHTEVLAERCGVALPTMMLCGDQLRVALATTHIPLADVGSKLTHDVLITHLRTVNQEMRLRFGMRRPRIAVCGLNPHAGEEGHLGREEKRLILPAIRSARDAGMQVSGPHAADTFFARAVREDLCDVVLAMYHDQGLIPLKLWHFGAAANVTLGLPIIRTSVDHGTAYDIAGTGKADVASLIYAARLAIRLAETTRELT